MGKSLLISVPVSPTSGGIDSHMVEWLLSLDMGHVTIGDWTIRSSICRDRPVVSTRNRLVKQFLFRDDLKDFDVLMSCDADQIPFLNKKDKVGGLQHLLRDIECPEVDVVNVCTFRITDKGPLPVVCKFHEDDKTKSRLYREILEKPNGLYELEDGYVGGAGIMVKRHVLQRFWDEKVFWFNDVFVEEQGKHFDELSGADRWGERLVGHDTWFFRKCSEFGFRTWVDTRVVWGHVKPSDLRAEFKREMDLTKQREQLRAKLGAEMRKTAAAEQERRLVEVPA